MSRNTPVNVTFAGWTARWSTSCRVPKVSELRDSSDRSPLTSVCPSVPPPLPSTAKAKSPRAPTRRAVAPLASLRLPGSMTFGLSTLTRSLHAPSGIHRATARARPICSRIFIGSSLLSEAQVDPNGPITHRRLRDEVAHEEVVPVEPLRLARLSFAVHLGIRTGVIRPRVQVATGDRDARARGVELPRHRLREIVAQGEFPQLDEPRRLDEPERRTVGYGRDEPPRHHRRLVLEPDRLVIVCLAALQPGDAAEFVRQVPQLVAAAVVELSPDPDAAVEQGQPRIEGELLGRLRRSDEHRRRAHNDLIRFDDAVPIRVVEAQYRSHPIA